MKKLISLVLTVILTLGLTTAALAATASLDILTDGKVDSSYSKDDLSQVTLGVDIPLDDFKISCNLNGGQIKEGKFGFDYDTASIYVKGGYALINDPQLRLDVTGGFYDRQTEAYDSANNKYPTLSQYAFMVGLDAKVMIHEQAWIDFSYGYGVDPQFDVKYSGPHYTYYDTYDLESISVLSCKFNVLLTEQLGVAVGYTTETIDFKDTKDDYCGLTLGGFIKF